MTIKVTPADERALRECLRRRGGRSIPVYELRSFLAGRLAKRAGLPTYRCQKAWDASYHAVGRLLSKWKREGIVDNPVRGRWAWTGERTARR